MAMPNNSLNRPVMLTDLAVFKVLPGGDKLTLRWDSTPEQQWLLKIAQHEVVVRGGSADLPMPQVSQDVVHVWELTEVGVPTKQLVGHWFMINGVEATDVQKLTNLLADYRSSGQSQAVDYREVCQWLYEEQLVHFNQWCLNP
ncbi:MAG: hypothetical protein ACK4FF_01995 [Limnobacter sp.]|uniref:hypothetical protein n=1 Tax=Limnobacter sp. TaxID=2003368 RepID=UPI003918E9A0